MTTTRRRLLQLLGPQWIGLRALASGLPPSILLASSQALAEMTCAPPPAQFLLFCTSKDGDPLNTNVPGTYDLPAVVHPLDPRLAPTDFKVGGLMTRAAKPWADLPPDVLQRTVFFHHTTRTNNHANQAKVMRLMGEMKGQEMLPSFIAKQLATCHRTIQTEPICLGALDPGERLAIEGRPQPNLSPTTLRDLLVGASGALEQLQRLRDADVNRLNAVFRKSGNTVQRNFIDRWAHSQQQSRQLSATLLQGLADIKNDGPAGQATAAAVLFRLQVSPVVSMHIFFGGDNHTDRDLQGEANATVTGVAAVGQVMQELKRWELRDRVSFMMFNVFGRELGPPDRNGRTHHADHHCSVLIGAPFRPGIIGGIRATTTDFEAMPIDPVSGRANPAGQIPQDETMTSLAKTVSKGLGVAPTVIDANILSGKVVAAALATAGTTPG